jgi:hypothetical protein
MPLINILITLIIVGFLLWLINNFIPMDGKIKKIVNIIVLVVVVIWLLKAFGILSQLTSYKV